MAIRKLILLSFSLTVFILSGCKSDFEVNEPWKEIDIIYGLLDVNDSVNYIKINKAFLNEDDDVYKLAGIEDSLFHRDTLEVKLQRMNNGDIRDEIELIKTSLSNKDSGLFHYPEQFLYATPPGYTLDPAAVYTLVVKNKATGNTATASTPVVQNSKPIFPSPTNNTLNFQNNPSSRINIVFNPALGAKFYDLTLVIHYEEYSKKDSVKIKDGVIEWPVFTSLQSRPDQPAAELRYAINGPDFFNVVAHALTVDGNVYRKLPAFPFEYKLTGGGAEIYNYMQVNRPSIGIVQKKPEYTNINNGYGIFSSRNRQSFMVKAGEKLKDDLMSGDMANYNFVK
jgi:hypothetical protein